MQVWNSNGQTINNYCGNPDNSTGGSWCFVTDSACQGGANWGLCANMTDCSMMPTGCAACAQYANCLSSWRAVCDSAPPFCQQCIPYYYCDEPESSPPAPSPPPPSPSPPPPSPPPPSPSPPPPSPPARPPLRGADQIEVLRYIVEVNTIVQAQALTLASSKPALLAAFNGAFPIGAGAPARTLTIVDDATGAAYRRGLSTQATSTLRFSQSFVHQEAAATAQTVMNAADLSLGNLQAAFASVPGVQIVVLTGGSVSTAVIVTYESVKEDSDGLPCFPSSATVVLASGAKRSLDVLQVGDEIVVATAEGALTTDTVSALSLADEDAESTFLVLSTAAGRNVTLTKAHHVPVGPSCCATLKTASEIELGNTVWLASTTGAAVPSAVTKMATVSKKGLHSPVMTSGRFPLIDGIVTAFDTIGMVTAAGYGIPILEATSTIELFKRVAFDSNRKFIRQ